MPRRNHVRHTGQSSRQWNGQTGRMARPPGPPVEESIIPHGRCPFSNKFRFHKHEIQAALRQAQALRKSRGQEAHMEVRFYECGDDGRQSCGSWHLTSRQERAS